MGGSKAHVTKKPELEQSNLRQKETHLSSDNACCFLGGSSGLWCYANNVFECEFSPDKGGKDERGMVHRHRRRESW